MSALWRRAGLPLCKGVIFVSYVITRPPTVEQLQARDQRKRDEQQQLEHDLIIAALLEKISELEAERNDGN